MKKWEINKKSNKKLRPRASTVARRLQMSLCSSASSWFRRTVSSVRRSLFSTRRARLWNSSWVAVEAAEWRRPPTWNSPASSSAMFSSADRALRSRSGVVAKSSAEPGERARDNRLEIALEPGEVTWRADAGTNPVDGASRLATLADTNWRSASWNRY